MPRKTAKKPPARKAAPRHVTLILNDTGLFEDDRGETWYPEGFVAEMMTQAAGKGAALEAF